MHRIAIMTATLILSACGGKMAPAMSYNVAIDPSFTTAQMESVTAALDDWKTAVPELQVTYAIAACGSQSEGQVCIHPAFDPPSPPNEVVGTTRLESFANATVWIYVSRIRESGMNVPLLTQQTAAHEFGHAMGLRHTASGELMAADVPDQAHTVTAADVAQFWAVRD